MSAMKRALKFTAGVAAVALLGGCSSDPLGGDATSNTGDTIVVGSSNFPESVLLGEIYAQALEAKGFKVDRKFNIGAREVYFQQLEACQLDLVPDYNQALLAFVAPDKAATPVEQINTELANQLPDSLTALESSAAQDNNAVVVTKDTADEYNLSSIADLAGVADDWVFGGPTEWETRPDGFAGIKEHYGANFKEYRVLDYSGPITISALDKGDIQAALLFSTVPEIAANDYVVLKDPDNVVGVNNITPIVCKDHVDAGAQAAANDVSKLLTTDGVTALNASYVIDKLDVETVAAEWLKEQGLD